MPGEFLVPYQKSKAVVWGMFMIISVLLLMACSNLYHAQAADISPVPPSGPSVPPPSKSPVPPESPPSKIEPSPRDPGMVKQPETVPHPDSVVTPPVVDPKMAIDPDAPTKEERHPMLPPEQTPQPAPPSR